MKTRSKMILNTVTDVHAAHGAKTLEFTCCGDESIPVDQRLSKTNPTGTLRLQVDSPEAIKHFVQGKSYFLDFTDA